MTCTTHAGSHSHWPSLSSFTHLPFIFINCLTSTVRHVPITQPPHFTVTKSPHSESTAFNKPLTDIPLLSPNKCTQEIFLVHGAMEWHIIKSFGSGKKDVLFHFLANAMNSFCKPPNPVIRPIHFSDVHSSSVQ